jgi:hypothetical protein
MPVTLKHRKQRPLKALRAQHVIAVVSESQFSRQRDAISVCGRISVFSRERFHDE